MLVEMILDEYRRLTSMPVNGWTMELRQDSLRKFYASLQAMLAAGTLTTSEYDDVQYGMKLIDDMDRQQMAEQLAAAYRKCFH